MRTPKGAKLTQHKLQDFIFRIEKIEESLFVRFVLEHSFYPPYMFVDILGDSFIEAKNTRGGLMNLSGKSFSFVSMNLEGTTVMKAAVCDRF